MVLLTEFLFFKTFVFLKELCFANFEICSGDELDSDVDKGIGCEDREILTGLNKRFCIEEEEFELVGLLEKTKLEAVLLILEVCSILY